MTTPTDREPRTVEEPHDPTDTECGCIKGVQTCKYHLDRQPRTVAPRDREDAPDRGITYEPETAYEQGFEGDLPRYFVAYGDHGELPLGRASPEPTHP